MLCIIHMQQASQWVPGKEAADTQTRLQGLELRMITWRDIPTKQNDCVHTFFKAGTTAKVTTWSIFS
jgi:hypothetical protein